MKQLLSGNFVPFVLVLFVDTLTRGERMRKSKLKDTEKRSRFIPVRVSEQELETVKLIAKLQKVSVSEYVRRRLIPEKGMREL